MNAVRILVASLVLCSAAAGSASCQSTTGSGYYRKVCPAYGTTVIHERYFGGTIARLTLVGDHHTNLDLFVYDEFDNLIAAGTNVTDIEQVAFIPRCTGSFRIVIRNYGPVFNNFVLRTN